MIQDRPRHHRRNCYRGSDAPTPVDVTCPRCGGPVEVSHESGMTWARCTQRRGFWPRRREGIVRVSLPPRGLVIPAGERACGGKDRVGVDHPSDGCRLYRRISQNSHHYRSIAIEPTGVAELIRWISHPWCERRSRRHEGRTVRRTGWGQRLRRQQHPDKADTAPPQLRS